MENMSSVSQSFYRFMSGIIDYAGLYPPANLPLDEAFRNFVGYQNSAEAWMLSRFIIPARRLVELSLPDTEAKQFSFSALARGGKDLNEFVENIKLDLDDIRRFQEPNRSWALVDLFEVALPASALTDKNRASDLVNQISDLVNKNGITIYMEAPFGEGWQMQAEKLIRALRKVKDRHVGFKLRTGGITPDAFPSIEQVAWAILETHDSGIPLKCTAGLHHPIRHFNASVQTKMHGFLNVFGAGLLAAANDITQDRVRAILEDENPESFHFEDADFAWKDLRVTTSEIKKLRHQVTTFGSCSFDEPHEDLRNLNLL